ncbi:MAG TPA: serine/threonine-protein kinase [Solirubrobacteraceae bacterium]|nr:serine/threonine-protein kinase [Solirubrobacteraceae bacterium]
MGFPTRSTRARAERTAATSAGRTAATLAERPPPHPGGLLILERYRLHRPLGAGGFGTVWMARDERLDRDVAVKVLARERIVGGRFEREARAAARLSHPGIVTLYEAAVDDDGAYLVSELVRGPTLSQLLEAGRLSDRDIVEVGIALCDALDHAHAHGVVHRDVKPSNVLIPERPSPGAVAKLTDFGVARVIGADTLTRTGDVIGTAAYMAPEQADGREAGAAADLFSLALVLYEAFTGVNPIALGTAAQRARRLGAHLPPLRRQRRDLPGELGGALDLALRPRPRERGSVADLRSGLIDSLEQVRDEPGIVEPAWPARSRATEPPELAPWTAPAEAPAAELVPPGPSLRWPTRALAGAAAGLIAAWLVSLPSGPPPPGLAAAGLAAAVLVAALPTVGWLLVLCGCGAWLAAAGYPGAALIAVLAALVPVLLLPRRSCRWPVAVGAPALGAVGLAGLWPALAGRWPTPWQRAGLGAVGWIWMLAAGLLSGHALYVNPPASLPAGWSASLNQTGEHVLPRLISPGELAPAVVWALAALLVPLVCRRSVPVRIVLSTIWAAGLASATVTALHLGHGGSQVPSGIVAIGALAAWIALVAPALTGWRAMGSRSPNSAAGLA